MYEISNSDSRRGRGRLSKDEWEEAVAGATTCLRFDAMRHYGLIEGSPTIDFKRCVSIVEVGEKRGVKVNEEIVLTYMADLARSEDAPVTFTVAADDRGDRQSEESGLLGKR